MIEGICLNVASSPPAVEAAFSMYETVDGGASWFQIGRSGDPRAAFSRAIDLTAGEAVRRFLLQCRDRSAHIHSPIVEMKPLQSSLA